MKKKIIIFGADCHAKVVFSEIIKLRIRNFRTLDRFLEVFYPGLHKPLISVFSSKGCSPNLPFEYFAPSRTIF